MVERWTKEKRQQLFRIGPLVKMTRLFKEMSQKEFCEQIGVSQGFLSKVEASQSSPDVIVWMTFCKVFRVDPYSILTLDSFKKECERFKQSTNEKVRRILRKHFEQEGELQS